MPPKLTIQDCHDLAEKHGLICMSTEYCGSSEKYLWKCKNNHQWYARRNTIQSGHHCRICRNPPVTTQDCYDLAEHKGYKFLSPKYTDSIEKYVWECSNGHVINSTFNDFKKYNSCGKCKIVPFSAIVKAITDKGGIIISTENEYINTSVSYIKYIYAVKNTSV